MAYEVLGSIEPQQEYTEFDLQIALKQPERVAQRGTEKPVEWKYFEGRGAIVYVTEQGTYIEAVADKGNYCEGGIESGYDLILLPEPKPFEPEEGKNYWAKKYSDEDPLIYFFSINKLWRIGIGNSLQEIHSIHPTPIEPPTEGFINLKTQSK